MNMQQKDFQLLCAQLGDLDVRIHIAKQKRKRILRQIEALTQHEQPKTPAPSKASDNV